MDGLVSASLLAVLKPRLAWLKACWLFLGASRNWRVCPGAWPCSELQRARWWPTPHGKTEAMHGCDFTVSGQVSRSIQDIFARCMFRLVCIVYTTYCVSVSSNEEDVLPIFSAATRPQLQAEPHC